MSQLQSQLKEARDGMGKALSFMREKALAMTEAAKKGEATSDLQNEYNSASADFEKFKSTADSLETVIRREAEMNVVVNAIDAKGEEKHADPAEVEKNRKAAVRETFMAYLRGGERSGEYHAAVEKLSGLGPSEKHALLGTQGTLGGFLVPEDFRAEVVRNMAGYAVVRGAGARVVPTNSSTLVFPSIAGGTDPYSSGVSGSWRAEGSQGTDGTAPAQQNQPTFGQERVPVHVWQPAAIVVTRELMLDSAVNLDSMIAQLIAETKALDEDAAFIKGDGVGRPRGILDYSATAGSAGTALTIANVKSGSNGGVQYNQLIDMMQTLPAQYRQRAVWITNSATFGKILQLKDSSQAPLLYSGSIPDSLFGHRVFFSEHVPAPSTGTNSIIFGDLNYYCVAERTDLRVQRLEERFAPNVAFLPTARLGGAVLRCPAFVIQNLAA
jgi:HK97 family phage major capsid protein